MRIEDRLATARNRLSDLEWRVQGTGFVALAVAIGVYLALGGHVHHPQLGSAIDSGAP